jgi:hypothetical protein
MRRRSIVATKKVKTAIKGGVAQDNKRLCPECEADARVVRYAGFGPKGLFWVCEKKCGYMERTR